MSDAPPSIPGISGWVPLTRGGSATVWKASQSALRRWVAVKVADRPLTTAPERERFLASARHVGALSDHPGIVTVHDVGVLADGRPYLVRELCPGGSLADWLTADRHPTADETQEIGLRIADALTAAHARGVYHGQIQPETILVDEFGHPGLADFGVPGLAGLTGLTDPGGDCAAYLPPEHARRPEPSTASDVYQLSATLYALHTGAAPTPSTDGPVPGRSVGPELDLVAALRAGLAADPDDRPTAAQLRDILAAVPPTVTPPVIVEAEAVATRARRVRRPVLIAVLAVAGLLITAAAAGGAYLYTIDQSVTANLSRGLELPVDGPGVRPRPAKYPEVAATLNYVLIGSDDGDPELDRNGRSDSIMIMHLNQDRDEAYVVSVPRDTSVEVPGHGRQKLNAVMDLGGPALVVATLERLTDTRMDHVVMIDFAGFVSLTEDLGGITVPNRHAFTTHGHTFPEGRITIRGEEALWFVRQRDALPSEEDRAANQRNVLKAILSKGLSPEVVADPVRFTRFLGNAAKRVRVDNQMTDREIRSTLISLRLTPSDLVMLPAPTAETRAGDSATGRRLDTDQMAEMGRALRKDAMSAYVRKYPRG